MLATSRKHLRTKVTPDFHLTYTVVKMGEICGWYQNDKNGKFSIFLHKIICCGCVLESPHRGDSNTHPKHMILWRIYDNYCKITGFFLNFMSMETFT